MTDPHHGLQQNLDKEGGNGEPPPEEPPVYILVQHHDRAQFEAEVNQKIKEGYGIVGGAVVTNNHTLFQTMVRHPEGN